MRVARTHTALKFRLAGSRVCWFCLLAGIFAILAVARPGIRQSFAQTQAPPQGPPAAAQASAASSSPGASAEVSIPTQHSNQEESSSPDASRRKQIADDTANLLKLANSLKTEVDKTTADTLSVTVVRRAGEIEELARKMRAR